MKPLTAQQIADATAKRQASVAARKATGGLTVRQQRAAAKAAKAGQSFSPPPPAAPRAPRAPRSVRYGRRRRPFVSSPPYAPTPSTPAQSTPAAPLFAPKPSLRPLRLAALAAIEALFKQRLIDVGHAHVTDEQRADFAKYKKLMGYALGPVSSVAMQTEADAALRLAVQKLIKHAF